MTAFERAKIHVQAWNEVRQKLGEPAFMPYPQFFDRNVHPVFVLTEHFRGFGELFPWPGREAGSHTNPHARGDHLVVPAYIEGGSRPFAIVTSFHKGDTSIDLAHWPQASSADAAAAHDLLIRMETR